MFEEFAGPALSSIPYLVVKYGAIWLALYAARQLIVLLLVRPWRSYLQYLPGPPRDGLFVADQMFDLLNPRFSKQTHEKYEQYGKNIRFQGMAFFDNRFLSMDPVSLNYMLNRASELYTKPWQTRRFVGRLISGGSFSAGIITSEGEDHRKLRRIIAPAFSHQSIKNLAPLFLHKSFELRDKIRSVLASRPERSQPGVEVDQIQGQQEPRVRIDVHNWVGRTAFDIIGVAAFGYEFSSIQHETNEVYTAYRCMFDALRQTENLLHNLGLFLPACIASRIPDARTKEVSRCRRIIESKIQELLVNRRQNIAVEKAAGAAAGKDLSILNLLLRTNETFDKPLTDSEIHAQIDTVMFAGHDTTSLVIEWGLWELARYPEIQARVRAELAPLIPILKDFESLTPSDSTNNYSDITGELGQLANRVDALPYFENVVREVLRLHPSVQSTLRVAEKDDIIPVSSRVLANETGEVSRAWVGGAKTGLPGGGIRISKGEFVHIPFEGMNVSKPIWGEDAHEFNPERWNELSEAAKSSPGLYAGLMTFSIGPHACPASRWGVLEMKMMLAVMIASFDFSGASPMAGHNLLVTRPYVDNQFSKGHRLPLVMTPL
ncbi:cytochrome P450 [Ceratobasidium sp. AG-I]|nr:cytochrome P450 [Ceratobasidium sp. AG-I]